MFTVLEKQLATIGVLPEDVCSGSGDGGGENEGTGGVHDLFEGRCPGYTRRRCLQHWGWRSAGAVLNDAEMSGTKTKLDIVHTYLHNGVTWSRLKTICATPITKGGASVCNERPTQFRNVFQHAPPKVIDERPHSYAEFLAWLLPREVVLGKCVPVDLRQRSSLRGEFSKVRV